MKSYIPKSRLQAISFLGCLALVAAAACRPAPETTADPVGRATPRTADELLRETIDAHAALAGLRGRFEVRNVTDSERSDFKGTFRLAAESESATGVLMSIDGTVERPGDDEAGSQVRRTILFDGETVTAFDANDGAAVADSLFRGGGKLFGERGTGSLSYFLDPRGFRNLTSYAVEFAGDEVTTERGPDGVSCHVLRLPFGNGGGYELCVGVEDSLLRRAEVKTNFDDAIGTGRTVVYDLDPTWRPSDDDFGPIVSAESGQSVEVEAYEMPGPALGSIAPDFTVIGFDGEAISLADLRGQIVLLDWWATWCGPCKPAMAALQELSERHSDQSLTVLGLTWSDQADPSSLLESRGITYATARGDEVAEAYGVPEFGLPVLFVIDAEGRLVDISIGYRGEASDRRLEAIVEELLPGP